LSNRAGEPAGAMVAGLSARLAFDEYYKDFLELVRTRVAAAIERTGATVLPVSVVPRGVRVQELNGRL